MPWRAIGGPNGHAWGAVTPSAGPVMGPQGCMLRRPRLWENPGANSQGACGARTRPCAWRGSLPRVSRRRGVHCRRPLWGKGGGSYLPALRRGSRAGVARRRLAPWSMLQGAILAGSPASAGVPRVWGEGVGRARELRLPRPPSVLGGAACLEATAAGGWRPGRCARGSGPGSSGRLATCRLDRAPTMVRFPCVSRGRKCRGPPSSGPRVTGAPAWAVLSHAP